MKASIVLLLMAAGSPVRIDSHGYVAEPPARNMLCGSICKPDGNGCANLQSCAAAFREDRNGGYQFMSVLTHDLGRGGSMGRVATLPKNVCGFDSETWQGGKTPWDMVGVDWPTTEVNVRDPLKIVWDISFGPHFSDTQEFVHYVTKDSFVYDKDRPLTWDDFESEPFCVLKHDPNNPGANQQIVPRVSDAKFDTWCNIPASKQGRHIIYAEWGRNQWTFERFHGCVDVVVIGGSTVPSPTPRPTTTRPTTPRPTTPPPRTTRPTLRGPTTRPTLRGPTTRPTTPRPTPRSTTRPTTRRPTTPRPTTRPPAQNLVSPQGIAYPCCGWNGNCEQPDNAWCHSECGRCTSNCNGIFYSAPGVGTAMCGTTSNVTKAGCCTWGGWTSCPDWTKTNNDPCQQTEGQCSACSGAWIHQ